jgi:hypothetical protein
MNFTEEIKTFYPMKQKTYFIRFTKTLVFILIIFRLISIPAEAREKTRLVILTDIGGDPDDQMSMVRLMTYANQIDIEALIATSTGNRVNPDYIRNIVGAYGKVRNNLELHEPGYPMESYLQERIADGVSVKGMQGVGEGKATPGSELLIRVVDRNDNRPVWVAIWGGPNVLAQALWEIRKTRSAEELARFVSKLRIYAISDQDDSGPWIREQFPELFYIVSPGVIGGGGYHHATWIAIGGDKFHGRFGGADYSLVTNEWLDKNVRSKGPLGGVYPLWKYMMEGDTPSFLNLVNNGLSDPDHPEWGGWGGRYELYTPRTEKWFLKPETRPIWTNVQDEVFGYDGEWHTTNHATIWRWRSAYQNDFAARMDWTIKPYKEANHPPIVMLDHPSYIKAKHGERVDLSAKGSTDPDGDALSFEWFFYEEPGTRSMANYLSGVKQEIKGFDQVKAWLIINDNRGFVMAPGTGTMHIILAVTDHGSPRLTRYQRIIIEVTP